MISAAVQPEGYDLMISVLSSILGGLFFFMTGLFIGWLLWRNDRKRLRDHATDEIGIGQPEGEFDRPGHGG